MLVVYIGKWSAASDVYVEDVFFYVMWEVL